MKNLVLSCLAVCALVSVVGCADNNPPATTTTESSSATMSSDTKDMGNHNTMSH
jgi:hypothetical protein